MWLQWNLLLGIPIRGQWDLCLMTSMLIDSVRKICTNIDFVFTLQNHCNRSRKEQLFLKKEWSCNCDIHKTCSIWISAWSCWLSVWCWSDWWLRFSFRYWLILQGLQECPLMKQVLAWEWLQSISEASLSVPSALTVWPRSSMASEQWKWLPVHHASAKCCRLKTKNSKKIAQIAFC